VSISLFYKATCSPVALRVPQTKQIGSFETSKSKIKKKNKKKAKTQDLKVEAREIQTENRFLSVELISLWNTFPKKGGESPNPSYVFRVGLNTVVVLATCSLLGSQETRAEVVLPLLPVGSDEMS